MIILWRTTVSYIQSISDRKDILKSSVLITVVAKASNLMALSGANGLKTCQLKWEDVPCFW